MARDIELAYPKNGFSIGIGPLMGLEIAVTEKNYDTEELTLSSSDGSISLDYAEGTITIVEAGDR